MGIWVVVAIVVGAAGLFALAWWSSGRPRGVANDARASGERGEAEARAMRHYRPNSSNPTGPM